MENELNEIGKSALTITKVLRSLFILDKSAATASTAKDLLTEFADQCNKYNQIKYNRSLITSMFAKVSKTPVFYGSVGASSGVEWVLKYAVHLFDLISSQRMLSSLRTSGWRQAWPNIGRIFSFTDVAIGEMTLAINTGLRKDGKPVCLFMNVKNVNWFNWLEEEIAFELGCISRWLHKRKDINNSIRTFISYCHHDKKDKEQFLVHLAPLVAQGSVTIWNDDRVHPGEDLDLEIKSNLERSQLFIALVSARYLNSKACMDEYALASHMSAKTGVKIVSVILRPCDWLNTPLSGSKLLPYDGVPVNDRKWKSKDAAFHDTVNGIRQAIKTFE